MKVIRLFVGLMWALCLGTIILFEFFRFKEKGLLDVTVVYFLAINFACLITLSAMLMVCGCCKSDVKIKKVKKLTETFQKLANTAGTKEKTSLTNCDIELFKSYANAMADI